MAYDRVTEAEEQLLMLAGGDPAKAELFQQMLEDRRRDQYFVKYWEPCGDQLKFWTERVYEKKVWVMLGGNRSGKTDLGCFLDAVWLLGKDYFRGERNWKWVEPLPVPDGPASVRVVALNADLLKDPVWEKLIGSTNHPPFLPENEIAQRKDHEYLIKFNRGSKLQGKSADVDPKTHGGPAIHLVHLDEECKKAIFDENYQRTIDTAGKLLVTATPLDDVGLTTEPWLYDTVEAAKAPDSDVGVVFMSSLNNPYLPEDEKRKLRAKWAGHVEERARLYGEFVTRNGVYYSKWKPHPPLWVPARPIPEESLRVVLIDPASNGPVGVLWLAFDRRGKMILYREYKESGLTASQHIDNILAENRGETVHLWRMDPFMGRQTIHSDGTEQKTVLKLWQQAGLPRLQLADIDYDFCLQESREYLNAAFDETHPHPGMEVFDHLTKFRNEIEKCYIDSFAMGVNKNVAKERPRKGNDDLLNCWQYACGLKLKARHHGPIELADPSTRSACN